MSKKGQSTDTVQLALGTCANAWYTFSIVDYFRALVRWFTRNNNVPNIVAFVFRFRRIVVRVAEHGLELKKALESGERDITGRTLLYRVLWRHFM